MNSQPQNASAWYQRYVGFFGHASDLEKSFDLSALISKLSEELKTEKAAFKTVSFLFNRYPSERELERHLHVLRVLGKVQALETLTLDSSFLRAWNDPHPADWIFLPENSVVIDVTSTFSYPYRTGIQRVVQELCRNIDTDLHKPQFIVGSSGTSLRLLSASETEAFLGVKHTALKEEKSDPLGLRLILKGFLRAILLGSIHSVRYFFGIAYHEIRETLVRLSFQNAGFKKALRTFDQNKPRLKQFIHKLKASRTISIGPNIFLFQSNIILPEIIQNKNQVNFYRTLRKFSSSKLMMIVYDLGPFTFPEFSAVGKEFTYYLSLLRVADFVSCISQSISKDVEAYMNLIYREVPEPQKISADLLAADFSNISSVIEKPSARLSELGNAPFALVVGTFEPRKNHWNILRAHQAFLKKNPDSELHLVFAGNPGWQNEDFIDELSKAMRSDQRIVQFVTLTDLEIVWLYQNCQFSIFCSHLEGFGLPILESLHWRKPVITSARGSMAEIAKTFGGCLTVNPNDPIEISNAIEQLANNIEELQSLKSKITFSAGCSWNAYAKNVLRPFTERLQN